MTLARSTVFETAIRRFLPILQYLFLSSSASAHRLSCTASDPTYIDPQTCFQQQVAKSAAPCQPGTVRSVGICSLTLYLVGMSTCLVVTYASTSLCERSLCYMPFQTNSPSESNQKRQCLMVDFYRTSKPGPILYGPNFMPPTPSPDVVSGYSRMHAWQAYLVVQYCMHGWLSEALLAAE